MESYESEAQRRTLLLARFNTHTGLGLARSLSLSLKNRSSERPRIFRPAKQSTTEQANLVFSQFLSHSSLRCLSQLQLMCVHVWLCKFEAWLKSQVMLVRAGSVPSWVSKSRALVELNYISCFFFIVKIFIHIFEDFALTLRRFVDREWSTISLASSASIRWNVNFKVNQC